MKSQICAKILEKTKKKLKPNLKIIKKVDRFVQNINRLLKKNKIRATCVKGGSVAKETFLKNDYDVDLFVRFSLMYKDMDLSNLVEKILPKNAERVHGSRDYFQIKKGKIVFEIVPVLKVDKSSEAKNVTDMSPLHVDWVMKKTVKNKGLKDEIRLAKQFCKSIKVYGAESYIKGFSGHILDILIIHYGSFLKLLDNAVNWKPKVVIDVEKKLENPLKELNKDKLQSPLIIVDPVQPERNAAAALSKKNFDQFIICAKGFLENPSEKYFRIKNLDLETIKKVKNRVFPEEELIVLKLEPLKGKKDVVGSKVMKAYEYIKKELAKQDFEVVFSEWEFGSPSIAYFVVKKEKLSPNIEIRGPPTSKKGHVKEFKKRHKKTKTINNTIYAYEKRKYHSARKLVKDLVKSEYVREKVKNVLVLKKK